MLDREVIEEANIVAYRNLFSSIFAAYHVLAKSLRYSSN
jgi:ABC-type siderophore export system fused ATPase/permease subunit